MLDDDQCYAAMLARDRRYDGVFFVAVKTTGVYCRPVCPARTPGRDRCLFFARGAEAERAGFRACFRCRPELAPGLASVDAVPRLVRAAAARIESGYLNEHSIEELSKELGVSDRHLRRAMEKELGVAPVELAQSRRLALAKQLLQDTALPETDVAFAAGFSSVRRFNASFLERFGRPPSALRRAHGKGDGADVITLRLDYRPPYDWDGMLAFLKGRLIAGVEIVADGWYRRSVRLGDARGFIAVTEAKDRPALLARVSLSLAPRSMEIAARLRSLFDLDARPDRIGEHLGRDARIGASVRARPGLRVPGAFDPFETCMRAVLGQQVTVRAASTVAGRMAERFGEVIEGEPSRCFPTPERLARAKPSSVCALGMPMARARTIVGLARAVRDGRIDLRAGADPEAVMAALLELPGIGPWTASYIGMRALRWPDAFPAGDLVVRRVLGVTTSRAAEEKAEAWRPWRAYAVMHLWSSAAMAAGG